MKPRITSHLALCKDMPAGGDDQERGKYRGTSVGSGAHDGHADTAPGFDM